MFINGVAKICRQYRATLQNYKTTWTSLHFWLTRKWSQPPQGDFFTRIILKREPCSCLPGLNICVIFTELDESGVIADDDEELPEYADIGIDVTEEMLHTPDEKCGAAMSAMSEGKK